MKKLRSEVSLQQQHALEQRICRPEEMVHHQWLDSTVGIKLKESTLRMWRLERKIKSQDLTPLKQKATKKMLS